MKDDIFQDLFVLELANNHRGDVERGKKIIAAFSKVVKDNKIKAGIKLQFRDADNFIHKEYKLRDDIRYIKKVRDTKMSYSDYGILVEEIKKNGLISVSTPFDEKSAEACVNLGVDIIKIASCDIKDKTLVEKIATLKKPVIISTGGSTVEDIDNIVDFFENCNISFAINHCVSIYPSEKYELELNQIDFLKKRYPEHVIGFSTHEYNDDIEIPMYIAYAKGARTFERHIDINCDGKIPYNYCSETKDIERWIKAYFKAKEICGAPSSKRVLNSKEVEYVDTYMRGIYAKRDLKAGEIISDDDIYLAIPLQEGQISCRESLRGKILSNDINKDDVIRTKDIQLSNVLVKIK